MRGGCAARRHPRCGGVLPPGPERQDQL